MAVALAKDHRVAKDTAETVLNAVRTMQDCHAAAKKAGVDATRRHFWKKLLGVTVGALALGALAAAAVASGGTALVAAAAIAGVVCAISVADAGCAYMNYKNAANIRDCKNPEFALPMGSSSLGNLFYGAFKAAHASDARAKKLATVVDKTVRVGLTIAGGILTMGAETAANSFEHIAPRIGSAANFLKSLVDVKRNKSMGKVYNDNVETMKEQLKIIKVAVNGLEGKLTEKELERLSAEIQSTEDVLNDVKALAPAVPHAQPAVAPKKRAFSSGTVDTLFNAGRALMSAGSVALSFLLPANLRFMSPLGGDSGGISLTPSALGADAIRA